MDYSAAWAKNPEDNVKTLDSAVDVQQALHANGPEAKGTKENVSDTQLGRSDFLHEHLI